MNDGVCFILSERETNFKVEPGGRIGLLSQQTLKVQTVFPGSKHLIPRAFRRWFLA